jgi:hypothetical protein
MVQGYNSSRSKIFSALQTSREAHPASYAFGIGSFAELKWLGHGADNLRLSVTKVANHIGLYLCLFVSAQACHGVIFIFTLSREVVCE